MKAIETRYKGYRFRSRLEARWAVFFDALGIKWEYEKEGYELPSGWYLPDFWLPEDFFWAEVKPSEAVTNESDLNKADDLARSSYCVLLLYGLPGENKIPIAFGDGYFGTCFNMERFVGCSAFASAVYAARGARFEHGESGAARR